MMRRMDEDVRAELRMLRARAYGPAADIDDDPVARERLAELEDMLRRPAEEEPPPAPVESTLVSSKPGPEPSAPEADEPVDAEAVVAGGIPRRALWLWTGSLVLVAGLVGGITYAATAIAPILRAGDGVRQIATLDVDPDPDFTEARQMFGGGEGSLVYESYEGLIAFSVSGGWDGSDDTQCITVVAEEHIMTEEGGWGVNGPVAYGCGAGSFPATAQLAINDALPDAVRERFADASALQFVLGEDQVGVFADTR